MKLPYDRTFIIAEIGINHNGSVDTARELVEAAHEAGVDAVKFQMRTPELSLPKEMWDKERDTPWGERMSYIDYRRRIELSSGNYDALREYCWQRRLAFGASPWDIPAAKRLHLLKPDFVKIASASMTNLPLIKAAVSREAPAILSTGMSTLSEIHQAYNAAYWAPQRGLLVCTSAYPCAVEDLHLSRMSTLRNCFPEAFVGYSGHEVGVWTTLCAVAMGARIVERHLTLNRSMKGSDHAASLEPKGLELLCREIRQFEKAKGSPEVGPQECERADMVRLRGQSVEIKGPGQILPRPPEAPLLQGGPK